MVKAALEGAAEDCHIAQDLLCAKKQWAFVVVLGLRLMACGNICRILAFPSIHIPQKVSRQLGYNKCHSVLTAEAKKKNKTISKLN